MLVDSEIVYGKKRERSVDDLKSLDSIQCHKKILCEGLTSLCLREPPVIDQISQPNQSRPPVTPAPLRKSTSESAMSDSMETDDKEVRSIPVNLDVDSENLLSMLKSGTRKYGRRVDYLVDELIKKSQKTHCSSSVDNFDVEDVIPSSVGPHPLTDRPLGKLWPTVVPTVEGAAMLSQGAYSNGISCRNSIHKASSSSLSDNCRMDDGSILSPDDSDSDCSDANEGRCGYGHISAPINWYNHNNNVNGKYGNSCGNSYEINYGNSYGCSDGKLKKSCQPAGTVTHSEWGIEDVVAHECAS